GADRCDEAPDIARHALVVEAAVMGAVNEILSGPLGIIYHDAPDDAPVDGEMKPRLTGAESGDRVAPYSGQIGYGHVLDHTSEGAARIQGQQRLSLDIANVQDGCGGVVGKPNRAGILHPLARDPVQA